MPDLIYTAGPYRAKHDFEVERNIRIAEMVTKAVWSRGDYGVCPHLICSHMGGLVDDERALAGTLELAKRCDSIMVYEGWQSSRGSCAEVKAAIEAGKLVEYAFPTEMLPKPNQWGFQRIEHETARVALMMAEGR